MRRTTRILAAISVASAVGACGQLSQSEKKAAVAQILGEQYGNAPVQVLKLVESSDGRTYCGVAWVGPQEVTAFVVKLHERLPNKQVSGIRVQKNDASNSIYNKSRAVLLQDIERKCNDENLTLKGERPQPQSP